MLPWHCSYSVALWTCIATSVLRPPCGCGNTLSCHSTPQTWDGFRTCSLNWFILVAPKSCGALKRWKSPALSENRCQVVSGLLRLSISPKIPSPYSMCVRKPQPPPSRDRWRWVEMVARQHLQLRIITPHPLATTQPPSSSPSKLQARSNLRPLTHTHTHALGTHDWINFLKSCSSLDYH